MLMTLAALAAAQVGANPGVAGGANPGASLIDRTRTDRALPRPRATPRRKAPDPATIVIADAPDTAITGIRFDGAQAPAPVARAAQPFLGRKASRQTLAELAAALAAAYAKADVALYTVAVPAQDFAGGVVAVRLIEGHIAGIDFATPAGPQLRGRLGPLIEERPLSRATFERQLTLARAIPGMTLATDLTDPAGTGALRLQATPTQKRRRLTAGYTSRGVDLLGAGQLSAGADFYGAGVDGDQVSIALAAAPGFRRFLLGTAGYSAPVGSSGLTAGVTGAYLKTRPRGRTGSGSARQLAASLSYPFARSFTAAGDVSLSLDGLNNDDATIAGIVATDRSRALRLAAGYSRATERRSWSVAASASRGLGIFGARSFDSDARFTKLTATASLNQAVGARIVARVSASVQYSRDALPAAERFALGGEAIGRAFDDALLSGDRGGGGLAELAWRPVGAGRFAQSELYVFGDAGRVRILSRGGFAGQSFALASAGGGGRLRVGDKGELGLEAARVVDRPYPAYRGDWRATASWRLTL